MSDDNVGAVARAFDLPSRGEGHYPPRVSATQDTGRADARRSTSAWLLAVGVPILLIALILSADALESPKTAYVGVLTAVPLFAAIFGTPLMTAITAVITWLSALAFGLTASDGNVMAQNVRLGLIALFGLIAIGAAFLRQSRESQLLRAQQEAATSEVLRVQAQHDDLTGLLNRRGVLERVAGLDGESQTLALLDCDDFKEINDAHGHPIGDAFLVALAGRLRGAVAESDVVARWGGDEFLLLVLNRHGKGREVVDRVVREVTSQPIAVDGRALPISLSYGVSELAPHSTMEQALSLADAQLYAAKRDRGAQ